MKEHRLFSLDKKLQTNTFRHFNKNNYKINLLSSTHF